MASLNRFFLCSCVFICVSNIYGEGPITKIKNKSYSINNDYYYFDFNFNNDSEQAGEEGAACV